MKEGNILRDVLVFVITLGVGYLVIQEYQRSRRKCRCMEKAATAATNTTSKAVAAEPIAQPRPATSVALAADGFSQRVY